MLDNNLNELIAKRLSGEINKDEQKVLDDWLALSDDNQETFKLHSSIWSDMKIRRTSKNANNVFVGISAAIRKGEKTDDPQIPKRTISIPYLWRGIAAAVLVLVTTLFVFNILSAKKNPSIVQSTHVIEKSLSTGQKLKIFLPDGSTVWLNAESSISYPDRFDDKSRIVKLTGEAFFDITKNPSKPFVVKTEDLDIRVLGTKFNVRNYHNEGKTDVALESGKVMVETSEQKNKYILLPGEGISMNEESGEIAKYQVNPKTAFQWKDGVIYFNKANFDEVINRLSRWYGVEFTVENYEGEKWEYSAEFKNDNLSNILQSMGFTKEFEYEIDQNKVTIKFN